MEWDVEEMISKCIMKLGELCIPPRAVREFKWRSYYFT